MSTRLSLADYVSHPSPSTMEREHHSPIHQGLRISDGSRCGATMKRREPRRPGGVPGLTVEDDALKQLTPKQRTSAARCRIERQKPHRPFGGTTSTTEGVLRRAAPRSDAVDSRRTACAASVRQFCSAASLQPSNP